MDVQETEGNATLRFSWDSAGLANVVCKDFELTREIRGRVLAQRHVVSGALRLHNTGDSVTATPVFPDRRIRLKLDLTSRSWGGVEAALRSQDTSGKCGTLMDPDKGLAHLRALAARGIHVRLPDSIFRAVTFPARLHEEVKVNERPVGLRLRAESLRVETATLWTSVSVQVQAQPEALSRRSWPSSAGGPGRGGLYIALPCARRTPQASAFLHGIAAPAGWHGGCPLNAVPPTAAWRASGRRKGGVNEIEWKLTLAGMGLLLVWGTCFTPAQASDDTWITTKIRIALLTTDGAGRDAVKVDTEHGKVTIHGTVDSEAVKEKAEATVRAVGGVTDVRNLLQVVKESSQDVGEGRRQGRE